MIQNKKNCAGKNGFILINTLVFAAIAIVITTALVSWAGSVLMSSRQLVSREQALQIAEAGVDYYRWHIAHNPTDYYDGNGATSTGPYVHTFVNKEGERLGQYSLTITPPITGSTLVKIKSTGMAVASSTNATTTRSILVSLAIPSFAKYAVLSNEDVTFGSGTEVFGLVHSNYGIHFDGLAHNLVTSAVDKYRDSEDPNASYQFGVYTTTGTDDPNPPAPVPTRTDVFMAGRQFPVPVVDFGAITATLSQIKADAQIGGLYFSSSAAQGYHLVLKTNDTFDLYKVTALQPPPDNRCKTDNKKDGWGTWSIKTQQFINNYPFPANGLIFVEDHAWVDGQINTARITIGVARFPESPGQWRNIIVNDNLRYTNYDGRDVVGLIAQGNVNTGLDSADVLRIDAAMVAQNGWIGRHHYQENDCGDDALRSSLTLYGMIASNGKYGFAYTDNTGYLNRSIIYDDNLLYAPPPGFPLASDQYSTISWNEVK